MLKKLLYGTATIVVVLMYAALLSVLILTLIKIIMGIF